MTSISEIEAKLVSGTPISRADARFLWEETALTEIGRLANSERQRQNPNRNVTYLVDRNINYTNVCNTDCSFCGFYRPDAKHPEAYVISRESLKAKLDELVEIGGSRVLLQGGHNDSLPYDYYIELIRWIADNYNIEINAFSPSEIHQMHKVSGRSYEHILKDLRSVGMTGLPGGGGEILDDAIRSRVSPKKIRADLWIEIMEIAQSLDLVTSASMVIGFGETLDHRLNHLQRIRDLQDRSLAAGHQGVNLFVSWILCANENTSLGRSRFAERYHTPIIEYMRNLALGRLFLTNIRHHQSSWPTLGAEIAQLGLSFGCDDVGSTMMEENVVSQAGAPTKDIWYMPPEELRSIIRRAGYIPAQRNAAFDIIKIFHDQQQEEARPHGN